VKGCREEGEMTQTLYTHMNKKKKKDLLKEDGGFLLTGCGLLVRLLQM
jgi:hypothetical protein